MAQSQTAHDIPTSGHPETIDSSSNGTPKKSDSNVHVTSYVGLGLAALILVAMVWLGGMWG